MRKKDFKLYADECVRQDLVVHLRDDHNFNIKSASEEGLKGKPDEIILKRANKTRRFLLTYNTKDFFANDKLCPFKGLFGIISLTFKTDCPYDHLMRLSRHYKHSLTEKKFLVSRYNISVRYEDEAGKKRKTTIDVDETCLLCTFDEAQANKV